MADADQGQPMAEDAHVGFVKVGYAENPIQAELMQGLLENAGIPSLRQAAGLNGPARGLAGLSPGYGGGTQYVVVRADQAERARALLAETMVADEAAESPRPVNARYLERAEGRGPRDYGLLGGYARIYLWGFAAMAAAFAVFLLLRAL